MWLYDDKEFRSEDIQDNLGFVYVIENTKTGRKYIGQKKFVASKTYQLNKKKKRKKVESNWLDYWGSNLVLQEDVKLLGTTFFRREILHLCKSKGWMNFLELKEQILADVLLSDDFYNDYLGARIHRKHLKKVT